MNPTEHLTNSIGFYIHWKGFDKQYFYCLQEIEHVIAEKVGIRRSQLQDTERCPTANRAATLLNLPKQLLFQLTPREESLVEGLKTY